MKLEAFSKITKQKVVQYDCVEKIVLEELDGRKFLKVTPKRKSPKVLDLSYFDVKIDRGSVNAYESRSL